jgi:hypothetical protein
MTRLLKLRNLSCLTVTSLALAMSGDGKVMAQDATAPVLAPEAEAPPRAEAEPVPAPDAPPPPEVTPTPEPVPPPPAVAPPAEASAPAATREVAARSSEAEHDPSPASPLDVETTSVDEGPAATARTGAPVADLPPKPVEVDSDGVARTSEGLLFHVGDYNVRAFGYVQAQYQNFQVSQNELSSDGTHLLNQNGFSLARARAIVEGRNEWSALALEYDVANLSNNGTGLQRAEATLHYLDKQRGVPFAALTFGMFRTPFGFEAARSARVRLWMENAQVTQAFFPGQSDTGVRLEGSYNWFRYALAYVNGEPINAPRFGGFNPIKQGDMLGRLGVDARANRSFRFVAGVSLLKGRGFSPGTPVTKNSVAISDYNENGQLQTIGITLGQATAATPSQTFKRWGAGADAEVTVSVAPELQFWLRGEFMFGSNLDRGLFIADPVTGGFDQRSWGAVGSFEALIYQLGWIGVRYDTYQPNQDFHGSVGGHTVSVASSISTTSLLAGFQLPGTLTRLLGQYDIVQDHLGLSTNGLPGDLKNNRFTLRLQVSL